MTGSESDLSAALFLAPAGGGAGSRPGRSPRLPVSLFVRKGHLRGDQIEVNP
jgi:hypothetical protein